MIIVISPIESNSKVTGSVPMTTVSIQPAPQVPPAQFSFSSPEHATAYALKVLQEPQLVNELYLPAENEG